MLYKEKWNVGNEDLIKIIIAFTIGFIDNNTGPQKYHYQDTIVEVNKNYQCPKYCGVNHPHSVYYSSDTDGIVIDKNDLGERIKEKRKTKKLK